MADNINLNADPRAAVRNQQAGVWSDIRSELLWPRWVNTFSFSSYFWVKESEAGAGFPSGLDGFATDYGYW